MRIIRRITDPLVDGAFRTLDNDFPESVDTLVLCDQVYQIPTFIPEGMVVVLCTDDNVTPKGVNVVSRKALANAMTIGATTGGSVSLPWLMRGLISLSMD